VKTADGKKGKNEIPIDMLKGLAEALGKVIHTDVRETTPMPPDQADLTDASTHENTQSQCYLKRRRQNGDCGLILS
uniref:Uncharacterized protein n=1 Tax=Caenorhabditis japonica TaxID=281687 RepID=A0A8R1EEV2_CAEJA